METEDKDPYAEGFDAFNDDLPPESNPYKDEVGTGLWKKGWEVARRAHEEGVTP